MEANLSLEPPIRSALKLCVIVPVYNAAKTIRPLIQQIQSLGLPAMVVNDGSTDQTAQLAAEAGALVINHLQNRGKGLALRSGFTVALEAGYDAVVTLDGDGQHDPREIPHLLERMQQPPRASIVIGQRQFDDQAMPAARCRVNQLMSRLISFMTTQAIPDSQCGFRVIRREVLATIPLSGSRFELESELLLAAAQRGWTIASVPIRTIYQGESSHIRPVRDALRFMCLAFPYLVRRYFTTRPLPPHAVGSAEQRSQLATSPPAALPSATQKPAGG